MEQANRIAAAIVVGSLVIAVAVGGSVYASAPRYAVSAGSQGYAVRVDQRTGSVTTCFANRCAPAVEDSLPLGFTPDNTSKPS